MNFKQNETYILKWDKQLNSPPMRINLKIINATIEKGTSQNGTVYGRTKTY